MRSIGLRSHRLAAFAAGPVAAGGWYISTASLLSGMPAQTIPAIGAIALAALAPTLALRHARRPVVEKIEEQHSQQLGLLKLHSMVNIVDHNHRLVEVNDKLLEATGYTRKELIGQPVSMLYADEDYDVSMDIRSHLVRGQGWQGETVLRDRDGKPCITQTTIMPLLDDAGTWIGSISARTDITHKVQLLSERETALTLHELRDDIWIIDEATETFRYMNFVAKRRFGWTPQSYSTLSLAQMADRHDCAAILNACRALKASDQTLSQFVTKMFGKTFEVSIKWLHAGTPEGCFLIMLHDMTDRMAQEKQQADFISMVSHELRSPLTSIKGSMGLLLSKAAGELPPKAEALLEIAHRNADRLVLIINDILDLEKIASGRLDFEIRECDFSELVHEVLRANAAAHQRIGLNVEYSGLSSPRMIETDPNRVIQVLTNLLSNAAKFSSPGGKVTITASQTDQGISVTVTDQGEGIPVADQHKVFQKFADMQNSERAAKGGTGLGLSICKAIIESLGGSITFESVEGEGTSFTFTLPDRIAQVEDETEISMLKQAG